MSEEFLGVVKIFAGNFIPRNYLACNGQLLQISQYQALYSILGTTYGGNGTSTFGLPDLRGRAPVGVGQLTGGSSYTLGEQTGQEQVTLTSNQLPSHTHAAQCYTSAGTTSSPANAFWAGAPGGKGGGGSDPTAYAPTSNNSMSPAAISSVGGGQPVPVLQPVLAITYIICVAGIYPSRN